MDEIESIRAAIPENVGPLAVDIDGTLTDQNRALDARTLDVLRAWPAPVVVATGKAMPYPVALCEFLGIDSAVIAENGGVVVIERSDFLSVHGNPDAAAAVLADYREAGHDSGWGTVDLINRWRETERAVSRDQPLEPLEAIAADHGLVVVDTGFAYHVKSPDVSKGQGLEAIATQLEFALGDTVAIGDSRNDVSMFEVAGTSIAVGNAPESVRAAADYVTEATYADGFLEAIDLVGSGG
jgi:phosphoglycolate phosphatase (TIGR01487 family)